MIKYTKFNRPKWDKEVEEFRLLPYGCESRFLSPIERSFDRYWDIKVECNEWEVINDELIKIKMDYLFPDFTSIDSTLVIGGVNFEPYNSYNKYKGWYSLYDYYEYCKLKGNFQFPKKWDWVIRDIKLNKLCC